LLSGLTVGCGVAGRLAWRVSGAGFIAGAGFGVGRVSAVCSAGAGRVAGRFSFAGRAVEAGRFGVGLVSFAGLASEAGLAGVAGFVAGRDSAVGRAVVVGLVAGLFSLAGRVVAGFDSGRVASRVSFAGRGIAVGCPFAGRVSLAVTVLAPLAGTARLKSAADVTGRAVAAYAGLPWFSEAKFALSWRAKRSCCTWAGRAPNRLWRAAASWAAVETASKPI